MLYSLEVVCRAGQRPGSLVRRHAGPQAPHSIGALLPQSATAIVGKWKP